jgi:hypothetical protein
MTFRFLFVLVLLYSRACFYYLSHGGIALCPLHANLEALGWKDWVKKEIENEYSIFGYFEKTNVKY